MFMRERVAPVVPKPPPGRYDGPLKIALLCDTADAEIYFTLDGSLPVSNSLREHGSRCKHYLPYTGYTLRHGGVYTLTVVAQKQKLVPTQPQVFTYHIDGAQFARLKPTFKDLPIDNRFLSMQKLDPLMSIRVARRACPEMECFLKDTCPQELLKQKLKDGRPLTLFKLLYDDRNLTRNDCYRRIVAPSMNMTMPLFPLEDRGGPNDALMESSRRSFTPAFYAQPDSLVLPQLTNKGGSLTGTSGALVALDGTLAHSTRAATAMNMNSTLASTIYRGITNDTEGRVVPSVRRRRKEVFQASAASTNTALAAFETRTKSWRALQDSADDKADKDEDAAYAAHCEETVQREVLRVGRLSEKFAKNVSRPVSFAGKPDIAADHKDVLYGLLRAQQLARNRLLHKMLRLYPVADLAKKLAVDWFNLTDLYNALDHQIPVPELTAELAAIAVGNPPEPTKYPGKTLVAVLRYMACAARPIPEAVFALLINLSRSVADRADGSISKPALAAAIEQYRHTRGSHPHILVQLDHLYHSWLPWERQGHLSIMTFLECVGDHMPMLDAAIGSMDDPQLGVYHTTVDVDSSSSLS